jgi:hypothetical protein
MLDLRRRQFITLLGGAAAVPFAARAQQSKMSVIGYLGPGSAAASASNLAVFRQSLAGAGYVEGRNIAIEYRFPLAELAAKELGLLHELVPAARRIGLLVNPNNSPSEAVTKDVTVAASAIGVEISVVKADNNRAIETASRIMALAAPRVATSDLPSTSYAATPDGGNSTWSWPGRWTGWVAVCRIW